MLVEVCRSVVGGGQAWESSPGCPQIVPPIRRWDSPEAAHGRVQIGHRQRDDLHPASFRQPLRTDAVILLARSVVRTTGLTGGAGPASGKLSTSNSRRACWGLHVNADPGPGRLVEGDVWPVPDFDADRRPAHPSIVLPAHWLVIPFACQADVAIARYGVRLAGLLPVGWCSTVVSEEGKNTLSWPSRQRTR